MSKLNWDYISFMTCSLGSFFLMICIIMLVHLRGEVEGLKNEAVRREYGRWEYDEYNHKSFKWNDRKAPPIEKAKAIQEGGA